MEVEVGGRRWRGGGGGGEGEERRGSGVLIRAERSAGPHHYIIPPAGELGERGRSAADGDKGAPFGGMAPASAPATAPAQP